jgi:hypothetical protein
MNCMIDLFNATIKVFKFSILPAIEIIGQSVIEYLNVMSLQT